MTTLEIILIIVVIYLLIAHLWNFINVACDCYLTDFVDLICNFFWIVCLPIVTVQWLYRKFKRKFKR